MANSIKVEIVSAEEEVWSGEGVMVFAPAELGEKFFYVSGGLLEVQGHVVTVLSDTALRAKDLDETAALEAQKRAEQALTDRASDLEWAQAKAELIQAAAQLRAIQHLRSKGGRA